MGRGRIALAIRVRGYGLTIDLNPDPLPSKSDISDFDNLRCPTRVNPSWVEEGARFRCPGISRLLTLLGLTRDVLEQLLDLAVLLALAVGPFADHLLFGPHMRDQTLNGFGEIGHRGGGAAARAALFQT